MLLIKAYSILLLEFFHSAIYINLHKRFWLVKSSLHFMIFKIKSDETICCPIASSLVGVLFWEKVHRKCDIHVN